MRKLICTLLILILCIGTLCGCNNSTLSDGRAVDIESVKSEIVSKCGLEDAMEIAPERLLDLYGISEEDIESSVCLVTMEGVFPDEIIMIVATDSDAKVRVTEKLESRLNEVKVQSQSYDPENYALAQECKVITRGDTVALFLSATHKDIEEIFDNAPMLADKK